MQPSCTSSAQRPSKPTGPDLPIEQLAASFNSTAAGAYREYEQMGDRPVSEHLEERAADLGIEFAHLGLTLGTVLHNVDLTVTPTPELTQLIRDTLLERKVIFFAINTSTKTSRQRSAGSSVILMPSRLARRAKIRSS